MPSIRVVAGLGNPGPEYQATRHNAGFRVLDELGSRLGANWKYEKRFDADLARVRYHGRDLTLVKPMTWMNLSGRALGALARFYRLPIESVAVAYDEVQVELGKVKVSLGGGPGGHNGVASLLTDFGEGWVRFRLGVGPKHPAVIDIKDFVLGRFTTGEEALLSEALPGLADSLLLLVDKGAEVAMNRLNRREKPPRPSPAAQPTPGESSTGSAASGTPFPSPDSPEDHDRDRHQA